MLETIKSIFSDIAVFMTIFGISIPILCRKFDLKICYNFSQLHPKIWVLFHPNKMEPKNYGTNTHNKEFVEYDFERLKNFYSHYKISKEFKNHIPYANSIPLKIGDKGFSYGKDVNKYKIEVLEKKFAPPSYLKDHMEKAVELFKNINKIRKLKGTDEYENNESMAVEEWNCNIIQVYHAKYFDQVGTNLTLDWASGLIKENKNKKKESDGKFSTTRNLDTREGGKLPELKHSMLANTLGVAVFVVEYHSENEKHPRIFIPIRSDKTAAMSEPKFHCSASGVFEWPENQEGQKFFTFDIFMEGMRKEITSEINLPDISYELIPLIFTRELARGGKPQLFFVAKIKSSFKTINVKQLKTMQHFAEEKFEFFHKLKKEIYENYHKKKEEVPKSLREHISELEKYIENPMDAFKEGKQELFSYEGWTGLKIVEAYLEGKELPFSTILSKESPLE